MAGSHRSRRTAAILASSGRAAGVVPVVGCAEPPVSPGTGGRSDGASPSRVRCAECCNRPHVERGPRPNVHSDSSAVLPAPVAFDSARAPAPLALDHPGDAAAGQRRRTRCAVGGCATPRPWRRLRWHSDGSVSHLNRVGRTLPATFGVRTGSIAHDDLHAWMTAQPVGEDIGVAIVEQVDGSVRFEVYEQRPVPALAYAVARHRRRPGRVDHARYLHR